MTASRELKRKNRRKENDNPSSKALRRHLYIELKRRRKRREERPSTEEQPANPYTFVRNGPKIGRNDPCPCGSGKKYKKCHGAHIDLSDQEETNVKFTNKE